MNIVQKIIKKHLISGEMKQGNEIAIKIDHTLTQDATGTMAYLQFEALGMPKVKTDLSVSYVDHNMLQTGFENADDHLFLQSIASKYGIVFSKPGNGICHQLHLERFAIPGKTLLGSDSHTPTAGGIGMLAIGAGGLDVAVAMGGGEFYLTMPKVLNIHLLGKLDKPWVSAKDVILEILKRLTVKGGVGKIIEYSGVGVGTLSVPERATITNMGAELGATTSIFPSDDQTRIFMHQQKRSTQWVSLSADQIATYDEKMTIDLREIEPLIAQPHSPDNVIEVKKLKNIKVNQVCIGSCTNSSYDDLMMVARLLKGRRVDPNVSLVISPGSRQVMQMITENGALGDIIASGARIIEVGCGPCIGMGQAPSSDAVTIRTFNRNFLGRSGTKSAGVYLASPVTAIAAALTGEITDPRKLDLKVPNSIRIPNSFKTDDSLFLAPSHTPKEVKIIRGPNIKPLPINKPLADSLTGEILLKVEDNITTDHIMPAGAKILPLRSNIPAISEHVFSSIDPDFSKRALEKKGGFIVGGENYGQGSSREHAALAPMYLGIKAVIVKSFARIHLANLINFGIIPLTFEDPKDYKKISQGDNIELKNIKKVIAEGSKLILNNKTTDQKITLKYDFSDRQKEIIFAGGLLNYTKNKK